MLWGSPSIPRHNFIAWLAILDRLVTREQQLSWGMEVLNRFGFDRSVGNWSTELEWICKISKGKSAKATLLRLAWRAVIYAIW
ncbi:hypothetical protein PTKIN_Ptkin05aG0118700 [Pterospermum kingtungense]